MQPFEPIVRVTIAVPNVGNFHGEAKTIEAAYTLAQQAAREESKRVGEYLVGVADTLAPKVPDV